MKRRYHFRACTMMGHCTDIEVEEFSEGIAAVEAKMHVEHWLTAQRIELASLVSFDLLGVLP